MTSSAVVGSSAINTEGLHDIAIASAEKDSFDQLTLDLTGKTYRYLDEEEIAVAEADKRKADQVNQAVQGGAE